MEFYCEWCGIALMEDGVQINDYYEEPDSEEPTVFCKQCYTELMSQKGTWVSLQTSEDRRIEKEYLKTFILVERE